MSTPPYELSHELVDAEVVGAEVVDAEVVDAEVVDAEVVGAEVVGAEVVGAEMMGAAEAAFGCSGVDAHASNSAHEENVSSCFFML